MFALVRTEPDAPKHDGISYLLIDMKTPGLDVRPLRQMTGDNDFNEVFFDNVRVPKENLVGPRGKGWVVSRSTLKHERALIGGSFITRRTFDGLAMVAQGSQLRGKPTLKDPVLRDRLVQLETRLLASEYNGYRLVTMQSRGEDQGLAGMVMKLFTTQLSYDISRAAMDVLGDRGALARVTSTRPTWGCSRTRTCGRSASSSPAARRTSSATSSPSAGSAPRDAKKTLTTEYTEDHRGWILIPSPVKIGAVEGHDQALSRGEVPTTRVRQVMEGDASLARDLWTSSPSSASPA
jgi:alkylation response protein AidB-like acyl-CoA dehydrogenase